MGSRKKVGHGQCGGKNGGGENWANATLAFDATPLLYPRKYDAFAAFCNKLFCWVRLKTSCLLCVAELQDESCES